MVTFKSEKKHYLKEESGLKTNTFRLVDWSDERFWLLRDMAKTGDYGVITIKQKGTLQSFDREITDVTFYQSFCIISWKHEEIE